MKFILLAWLLVLIRANFPHELTLIQYNTKPLWRPSVIIETAAATKAATTRLPALAPLVPSIVGGTSMSPGVISSASTESE